MSKAPSLARLRLLDHILYHHFQPTLRTSGTTWRCISTITAIKNGIREDRGIQSQPPFKEPYAEKKLKKRAKGAQERFEKYKANTSNPLHRKKAKEFPESMRRRAVALEVKAAKWQGRHDTAVTKRLEVESNKLARVADSRSEPSPTPSSKPEHKGFTSKHSGNSPLSVRKHSNVGLATSRDAVHDEDDLPVSVPYTTAASVFLYGLNTVRAALLANRRKIHAIHLQRSRSYLPELQEVCHLARQRRIKFNDDASPILLSRMSEDRPHNGVVLEVSRLPVPPVRSLGRPDMTAGTIAMECDPQSPEDSAITLDENGSMLPMLQPKSGRQPLIVMLDGILDPQNLGNILRTAHFYGVDAVAIGVNTCANIDSGIVAKASSGACEAVRILALPKPSDFTYQCKRNGWKILASCAPLGSGKKAPQELRDRYCSTATLADENPLASDPCILMLGSEGEGLRDILMRRADRYVTINKAKQASSVPDIGLDSINVGVAAGILLESILREPCAERGLEPRRESNKESSREPYREPKREPGPKPQISMSRV